MNAISDMLQQFGQKIQGFMTILFSEIQAFTELPNFRFGFSRGKPMVSYIVGPNLSASDTNLSADPSKAAIEFLYKHFELFGLEKSWFTAQVYVKHRLESRIGQHVILGVRWQTDEIEEQGFVVHLDNAHRVVMVTSHYYTITPAELTQAVLEEQELRKNAGAKAVPERTLVKSMIDQAAQERRVTITRANVERVFLPLQSEWQASRSASPATRGGSAPLEQRHWVRGYKIKAYTDKAESLTILARVTDYSDAAKCQVLKCYSTSVGNSPYVSAVGIILKEVWTPDALDQLIELQTLYGGGANSETVVLRDLNAMNGFNGKYVRVENELDPINIDFNSLAELAESTSAELSETTLDCMMAYYHLDRIQRYFRGLGLDCLDTYSELNPLVVVLEADPEIKNNKYESHGKKIHIRRFSNDTQSSATCAREPRVLYHEYVHAVTDALSRLNRGETDTLNDSTDLESLQAAAMDEGFADYFACGLVESMPARHVQFKCTPAAVAAVGDGQADEASTMPQIEKARPPVFFSIAENEDDRTEKRCPYRVKELRRLDSPEQETRHVNSFLRMTQPTTSGTVTAESETELDGRENADNRIYEWGTLWSSFLWRLRTKLGKEVADTIVAHSFLFLTRWSTFSQGVLAIALADYLLFGKNPVLAPDTDSIFGGLHEQEIYDNRPKDLSDQFLWNDWNKPEMQRTSQESQTGLNTDAPMATT